MEDKQELKVFIDYLTKSIKLDTKYIIRFKNKVEKPYVDYDTVSSTPVTYNIVTACGLYATLISSHPAFSECLLLEPYIEDSKIVAQNTNYSIEI